MPNACTKLDVAPFHFTMREDFKHCCFLVGTSEQKAEQVVRSNSVTQYCEVE